MLLNKKCIYLGVSLFSAMILGSMNNQSVKAATTNQSTSTQVNDPSIKSTKDQTITSTATITTEPASTTQNSASSAIPATGTSSGTGTITPSTSITGSTGIVLSPSTGTTTGTTTPGTSTTATNSTTSTATVTDPYALPSYVPDDTVVNIPDSLLNYMVKQNLQLSENQNITVADIKKFNGVMNLYDAYYLTNRPSYVGSQVETFSGLQYLKFLSPVSSISLNVTVAWDKNANPDLRPLEGLNFTTQRFSLVGNFSDPNYKEIDASQIGDLSIGNASVITLTGSSLISDHSGIDQAGLEKMAPALIKIASTVSPFLPNGPSIFLNNTNITDLSPLNGIGASAKNALTVNNNSVDPTTLYAVTGQPMTFTAQHITGLNGKDLSSTYTITPNVPLSEYHDNNMSYLGNDQYVVNDPTGSGTTFTYGNVIPAYNLGNSYSEKVGGTYFYYSGTTTQPIVWQNSPTVKILYVDSNNQPILSNGSQLTETVDGTKIGSNFDLTPYTKLTGYTFVSSSGSLTGAYTQDPQTQTFVFKENPVTPTTTPSTGTTTGTTTPSTGTTTTPSTVPSDTYDDEGTTTPSTPTTPVITTKPVDITVSAVSKNPVQVYGPDGSAISGKTVILADTTIKQSATINGTLYYQIGDGEWVPASDFNTYQASTGIAKTGTTDATLVNSEGVTLDYKLAANTAWKYDRIVTIQGKQYYEVGNNEYLSADDSLAYTPVKADLTIKTPVEVYNSEGKEITRVLPTHSDWATDGISTINGVRMYHVGTNEWISAENVNPYTSVKTVFNSTTDTPVFDITGELTKRTLDPGTAWKVDRITEINGAKYYRVAENEFVKVPDTSITVANNVIDVENVVPIYDEKGNLTDLNLAADTAWRFDKTVTIGGQKYYRVATDEYVKA